MKYRFFEELPVWKQGFEITERIYKETNKGAFSKDYGLRDQIRRSAISITSNIAEGFERSNTKEFIRFLAYAKASAAEARSQTRLAIVLKYISPDSGKELLTTLTGIGSSLSGFMTYLKSRL